LIRKRFAYRSNDPVHAIPHIPSTEIHEVTIEPTLGAPEDVHSVEAAAIAAVETLAIQL
jgi:hypothetical protein